MTNERNYAPKSIFWFFTPCKRTLRIRLKEWKPAFAYKPTYAFLLEKMLAKTNDIGICGQKKHDLQFSVPDFLPL